MLLSGRGEVYTLTDLWLNKEVKMMPGILKLVVFQLLLWVCFFLSCPCSPGNNANSSYLLAFQ